MNMSTDYGSSQLESERLASLYELELLDTPHEPEFDELVEMAAAICEAPIGLISLLDERRQWFKAVHGLDLQETAREVSFCSHAIQQRGVMLVEDALLDPRFMHNPYVVGEQQFRFYAGVPISSPSGHALGTLCVLDHVARSLTQSQVEALQVLGSRVNSRLALRAQRLRLERALLEAHEANARLEASERAIRVYQKQLEAANQRLMMMATTDPLTGLLNRHAFNERMPQEFTLARRYNHPLSVLLLDLDNFKQCNDRFGHDAGDQILALFAHLLRNAVRETDMVVRYGGEEFLVLLPQTDAADAVKLGRRILQHMHEATWPRGPVTASIGCASLTDAVVNGTALVSQADDALYAAKRAGKNRALHFNDQVDSTDTMQDPSLL
jgi:diguanylate cyclase (GGDEF)-like protein